jgi:hypothetical protein
MACRGTATVVIVKQFELSLSEISKYIHDARESIMKINFAFS